MSKTREQLEEEARTFDLGKAVPQRHAHSRCAVKPSVAPSPSPEPVTVAAEPSPSPSPEPVVSATADTSAAEAELARLQRQADVLFWQAVGASWARTLQRQRWRVLMATTPYYRA